MKIELRDREGVAIAALEGRLQQGVGDVALRDLVNDLLADGRTKILLDLSGVPSIDSSGVGELVASLKVAEELEAELKILQVSDGVRHVLDISQILPLFETFHTEDEALAAFAD